jgi:hypothetical protein
MQGNQPDNMRRFWRFLLRKSLPPDSLSHMQFAVFGLGDSGYPSYNVRACVLKGRLACPAFLLPGHIPPRAAHRCMVICFVPLLTGGCKEVV